MYEQTSSYLGPKLGQPGWTLLTMSLSQLDLPGWRQPSYCDPRLDNYCVKFTGKRSRGGVISPEPLPGSNSTSRRPHFSLTLLVWQTSVSIKMAETNITHLWFSDFPAPFTALSTASQYCWYPTKWAGAKGLAPLVPFQVLLPVIWYIVSVT